LTAFYDVSINKFQTSCECFEGVSEPKTEKASSKEIDCFYYFAFYIRDANLSGILKNFTLSFPVRWIFCRNNA